MALRANLKVLNLFFLKVTNANLLAANVVRDIHDFTTPEMVTEEVDGDQVL